MGFTMHFYIIFGTNLLTEGPVQIVVFLPISVFRRKGTPNEIQTEWNLCEDLFLEKTQSRRLGVEVKEAARKPRGRRARPRGVGVPPTLVDPFWLPWPTSLAYIYLHTLKTSRSTKKPYFHRRNLLYPWDPILRPFPALRRRGGRSRRASTSTP